jgi:hypothetical protein
MPKKTSWRTLLGARLSWEQRRAKEIFLQKSSAQSKWALFAGTFAGQIRLGASAASRGGFGGERRALGQVAKDDYYQLLWITT